MQTINISLPKNLFEQIRLQTQLGSYASISEFIREASRYLLRSSSVDFTQEAQAEILKISKQSLKDDLVFNLKKTTTKKIFQKLKKTKINA